MRVVRQGMVSIALMGGFAEIQENKLLFLSTALKRRNQNKEAARMLTPKQKLVWKRHYGTLQSNSSKQAIKRARARFQAAGGTLALRVGTRFCSRDKHCCVPTVFLSFVLRFAKLPPRTIEIALFPKIPC